MIVTTGHWPNGKQFIIFDYAETGGPATRTTRICWTPTPVEWRFIRQMLGAMSS